MDSMTKIVDITRAAMLACELGITLALAEKLLEQRESTNSNMCADPTDSSAITIKELIS